MADKKEDKKDENNIEGGFGDTQKKGKLGDIAKSQDCILSDENDDMARLILKIKSEFNDEYYETGAPVYGILSMLLQKTPLYCYDHPGLKGVCQTAMTDGTHVLIDADFLRELDEYDKENSSKSLKSTHFLVMHELMHKLFHHVDRMSEFPHRIANVAQDIVINSRIQLDYPQVKPCDGLIATSTLGFTNEDIERSFAEHFPKIVLEQRKMLESLKDENEKPIPKDVLETIIEGFEKDGIESFEKTKERREFFSDIEKFGRVNEEHVARILMEKFQEEFEDKKENGQGQGKGGGQGQGQGQGGESGPIDKEAAEKMLDNLKNGNQSEGNGDNGDNSGQGIEFSDDVSQDLRDQILEELAKNVAEEMKSGKGDGKGKGKGKGGNRQSGSDGIPDGYVSDGVNAGRNPMDDHKGHTITMKDLRDKLNELGLGYANDLLKIPEDDDELQEKMDESKKNITDVVTSAVAKKRSLGDKFPGAHCTDFASELLGELAEPEIDWEDRFGAWLRRLTAGVGRKGRINSYDEMHMFNTSSAIRGITGGAMFGTRVPVRKSGNIVAIVDTSGSMSQEELKVAFGEVFGMLDNSDYSPTILLYQADTAIRNQEPIEVTTRNYKDIVESFKTDSNGFLVLGGGGTDLVVPVEQVMDRHGSKCDAILHFTDFGFYPPEKSFFEDKPPVCIIGIENNDSHVFEKALRDVDGADVIMIKNPEYEKANNNKMSM